MADMKIFQISGVYPTHRLIIGAALREHKTYQSAMRLLLASVSKSHILKPCLEQSSESFLTFHNEPHTMRLWALENGMGVGTSLDDILLAQIEAQGAEVLYNVDASRMSASLIRRLPSCVRLKIAWLGSPIVGDGFQNFDAVVSNFPSINAQHKTYGLRTEYFIPSYDPSVESLDQSDQRDIDLLFVGGYSRHHQNRASLLKYVAASAEGFNFSLHLDNSRYMRIADTPLGFFPPFSAIRRPKEIRHLAQPPVFGQELFCKLGRSKIVINMAIDMAGNDRGNLRCFEALSAGSLLLSDFGSYPEGFHDGKNMVTYRTPEEAVLQIKKLLKEPERLRMIAQEGRTMVRQVYSKERHWSLFKQLCNSFS